MALGKCLGGIRASKFVKEIKRRKLNIRSWLLILYTIAVGASIQINRNIAIGYVTMPEQQSCYAPFPELEEIAFYLVPIIQFTVLALAFPIVGWIGDTKIGRGKAVELSMWCCWLGTLLQVISHCIQYGTCGLSVNIAKYGLSSVAVIFLSTGTGGFLSNSLAYGLDQLIGKSSSQIRAYIHWMVWGLFVGFSNDFIAYNNDTLYHPRLTLLTGLMTFTYISVTIVLSGCLRHKLKPSYSLKINPYIMVYNVLKYAKQHKSAVNRSAFTYWQDKIPSRIDLGKRKYGGPFSETEVEDVKTLLRIFVVLLSTIVIYIPYFTTLSGIFPYINKLQGATSADGYGSYLLWSVFNKLIIIIVPLLELVIIPLFPKVEYFIHNPLKGLGVSYIFMFVALILMLTIDGGIGSQTNAECAFDDDIDEVYKLSFLIYMLPLVFIGLVVVYNFVFSFEFICSQSPSNMSGMLTGLYWFIHAAFISMGAVLIVPFYLNDLVVGGLSCTFWNLLLQIIICAVGGGVFTFAAMRYKWRKRDEEFFVQNTAEAVYDRALSQTTETEMGDILSVRSL